MQTPLLVLANQHQRLIGEFQHLEVHRESVCLMDEIGHGQFGSVYNASAIQLPNNANNGRPMTVAVKSLKDDGSTTESSLFVKEAARMRKLSHKNVLGILAVCFQSQPNFILMEFMENGDLKAYLRLCTDAAKDLTPTAVKYVYSFTETLLIGTA